MKIDVPHIAKLANLVISETEAKKFEDQLSSILEYINRLKKVNTENVDETSQITNLVNVTKNDETSPSLTQEEALSNTKSKHNGLFKVKAVFENE